MNDENTGGAVEATDISFEDDEFVYTVHINQEVCVGGGQCVFAAPEVFTQRDEDGVVQFVTEYPSADERPDIEEAIEVCPAQVISMTKKPKG